ncbi:beta-galactosidase [Streptomyces sp. Rer75]|uniref:beta-galactosidase n=1 Tax=Streptomyces sp. Rer75 TaxID=2750011 RepID=UPI0015D07BAE|nr:beta-galactosidase [Streptomyces sp. Rer75]QLH26474.1 beta-galactosidase [Streptomyces sp. Rer75]
MQQAHALTIDARRRLRPAGIAFGGDYNPEQWPEEVWAEDVALMKEAGVSLVTAGIFSWAKVEPRPGEFDFAWFDRVMDNLAAAGVAVCLATMTASPPPWLSRLHPHILPETADGRRMWPGGRQHYCPSSGVYRSHATRLVERLASRYADHPALEMWHIGNEYGCHTPMCWCDESAADFRRWLSDRYGAVEALNDAWSTAFWAQGYDSFDVPVTTNFIGVHKPVDAFRWAAHEDVVSVDVYQDPHDQDTHIAAGFIFDVARSARGGQPWMLMEQAPSAVNWRDRNGPKPPGRMRLWSWQAVAQGADAVLYFQWRQSRGGAEKYHSAMLPHGGTGTRTFREVAELGRELASVPQIAGTRCTADVALVLDWNSWWALELDSHPSTALNQMEIALAHYRPLFEAGITCDVVPPDRDLSGYRLVVVPNLYLLRERDADRLTAFVRGGGHLLVSFFSGIVDDCDRVHLGGYPAPLREVLGLHVEEFWPLPEQETVNVRHQDGAVSPADLWSEVVVPEGARTVATFDSGPLAGQPAVTRNSFGEGSAWYVATRLSPQAMRALTDEVCRTAEAGPVLPGLPGQVQATVREGDGGRFVLLLNHGREEVEVGLAEPMTDALAQGSAPSDRITLPGAGVAVLSKP